MLGRVGLRCAQLDLSVVRQSPTALALHLDGLGTAGIDAVVCDADTGEDLGAIAAAATRMASRAIWVGSGGLAKELARVMAFGQAPESSAPLGVVQAGSIVTVVGSRSRVAHEQVRYLHTCPAVELISVSTAVLLGRADTRGWRRACAALQMAVDSGRDVVLSVTAKPAAPPDHLADERLTVALGALVSSCVTKPAGLILTGGETARAVLRAGGVRALRIRAETAPGIVLSTSERFGSAHGWSDIPVMTKAGAFGGADALASCRAELRAQSVAAVASQPGES
jgi:uncharacterized protein YgbK (DUF1537 family)